MMESLEQKAKNILKKARSTAKMAMKEHRIDWILGDFEKLHKLEKEGYHYPAEKEAELREIAYRKGVLYCLQLGKRKIDSNPQRTIRLYALACYNAHLLGREIPTMNDLENMPMYKPI